MTARMRTAAEVLVASFVVAVLAVYLVPRLVALNRLPGRMDHAVASAGRYNAGLEQVTRLEGTTLANLGALDQVRASLTGVLATLSGLGGDLAAVTARVQGDLAGTLAPTVPALARLDASLGDLEARTRALGAPVAGSAAAITDARATLGAILAQAGGVADALHQARVATDGIAANVAPVPGR